jgi:hypothetical protein
VSGLPALFSPWKPAMSGPCPRPKPGLDLSSPGGEDRGGTLVGEGRYAVGDKGKKDKDKGKKQKATQKTQDDKARLDKQPKRKV